MRSLRPVMVLGLVALTASILAAPAGAKGGPPVDAGAPPGAGPKPVWKIDHDDVEELVEDIEGDARTISGAVAGAAYVGQVPDGWEGERLLVWAHGYRGEFETDPLLTVDAPPQREWLLDNGYAWIASSYRRNSYDPGIGVLDTKNALKVAEREFGKADHTYIAGVSMGGHVTGALIEQFPTLFDGALPACGVMGDVELFDYFLDYNVGAAAFAGLDADEVDYPSDSWIADTVDKDVKPSLSFLGAQPEWAYALTPPGVSFKNFVEIGSGGIRGELPPFANIYDVAWEYWHAPVPQLGNGNFFFSLGEGSGTIANRVGVVSQNSDTEYAQEYGPFSVLTSEGVLALDDAVARVEASNRVRSAQGSKPAPIINGTPQIPVLTIHTLGDLFVPIEMQQIYAREVAANGLDENLVQRAIRDVGHCSFSHTEWQESYTALQDWVEDDIRPAGEDVTDLSSPVLGACYTVNDPSVVAERFSGLRVVEGQPIFGDRTVLEGIGVVSCADD